ncbi:hypothetical protein DPMN_066757 [Dreissena polymorpha]|uniref:Uncharacterized protein n=1 Tax=Dreissena polymorpha TaxID=45954 RepID=A0A9D3YU44_DREPO|nr:hypothetical protein DPMN_066757 [Dreissena polymorpha]
MTTIHNKNTVSLQQPPKTYNNYSVTSPPQPLQTTIRLHQHHILQNITITVPTKTNNTTVTSTLPIALSPPPQSTPTSTKPSTIHQYHNHYHYHHRYQQEHTNTNIPTTAKNDLLQKHYFHQQHEQ